MFTRYNLTRFFLSLFSVAAFIQFQPATASAQWVDTSSSTISCPVGWVCTPVNPPPTNPTCPTGFVCTSPVQATSSLSSLNPTVGFTSAYNASLSNFVELPNTTGEDRTGPWSYVGDGQPDLIYQVTLTTTATKTLENVMFSTGIYGRAGFTSRQLVDGITLYPPVLTLDGRQLQTDYDQPLGTYQPGTYTFKIYGVAPDDFGTNSLLTFYFSDGTYVQARQVGSVPTPPVTPSSPVVTITGQPSLALAYSGGGVARQEAALKATFNFTIQAGNQPVYISKNGGANVQFVGSNGAVPLDASKLDQALISSFLPQVTINGKVFYVIQAGQYSPFVLTTIIDPKLLFAGNYYTTLADIQAQINGSIIQIAPSANKTNSVTVVGEVTPYISSVTSPVSGHQQVTITGQRLTNTLGSAQFSIPVGAGQVYIDGHLVSGVSALQNSTSLSFNIPSLTTGSHSLYVQTSAGKSNVVNFQVSGGATTTPVLPTTSPTVVVNGQPTLTLSYDAQQKESSLVATFNITVNGGSNGVNIYQYPGVGFYMSNNTPTNTNSGQNSLSSLQNAQTITDNNGQSMYHVPANQSLAFRVQGTKDPGDFFAGAYYASLVSVTVNPGTDYSNQHRVTVPANKTNSKTIVGELGPYITGAGGFDSPQTIFVAGQRLAGVNQVEVDGVLVPNANISIVPSGANLAFKLPANTTAGIHTVDVISPLTGKSNKIQFTVVSGTTVSSSSDIMLRVSNAVATLGSLVAMPNVPASQALSFSFSLTAGNAPVYLSKSATSTLALSASPSNQFAVSVASFVDNDSTADSANYFYIPPGVTKIFIANYRIYSIAGASGSGVISANSINYGWSASNLSSLAVTSGLSDLKAYVDLPPYNPITPPITPPTPPSTPATSTRPGSGPVAPVIAPTCTLKSDKASYVLGDTIKLTWTSKNAPANSIAISSVNNGNVSVNTLNANGSRDIPSNLSPLTGPGPMTFDMYYAANGQNTAFASPCSVTVTILSNQPTLSIAKNPASVTVNQNANWTITINNPTGTPILYSVDWGDSSTKTKDTGAKGTNNYTLGHIYPRIGTYTITFTVTSADGKVITATSNVTVDPKGKPGLVPGSLGAALWDAITNLFGQSN